MSDGPPKKPSERTLKRFTKDLVAPTEDELERAAHEPPAAPPTTVATPSTVATPTTVATPAPSPAAHESGDSGEGSERFTSTAFGRALAKAASESEARAAGDTAAVKPAEPATAPVPPPRPEGDEKSLAPRSTTKKFLEAVSNLLGSSVEEAAASTVPTHPGAPTLMESDPLTPERFQTRTKKLLSERLNRPSRKFAPMPGERGQPAIIVRDLDATYEEHQVLFDLNFSVQRGEILAILGGSGSGKTTLLKHLIGLLRPSRGLIEIAGQDIAKLEGDDLALVLKSIGMLFQYSALFNSMTIAENVALPLREYTDLPDPAIEAIVRLKLALVGLPAVGALLPNELSGGMKKRAALARALALDPDVLFFDEPGSGLDPIAAAALDQLILHLNRAFGTTMVIVTHDLENAFNVAHRILMLDQGRIRKIGTPAEVRSSKDPWVTSFLARSSALRDAVDESFFSRIGVTSRVEAERGKPL